MKCLLNFFRFAALIIFSACLPPVRAVETNAVIPYKTLDAMFQPVATVDPAKLEIHIFISSTNKAVHPSDITLTIHSATEGMIPLLLNTNGRILKFPHEKELARENPPVVSNQPKGALRLMVAMQLPPSDDLTFRYRRLGDGVAEMNKSIKAQAGMMSLFAPKVRGVVFLFPKTSAGKATVEIQSSSGVKKYTADKNGLIKLKLENTLLAENPAVVVSEIPKHVVPDMEGIE